MAKRTTRTSRKYSDAWFKQIENPAGRSDAWFKHALGAAQRDVLAELATAKTAKRRRHLIAEAKAFGIPMKKIEDQGSGGDTGGADAPKKDEAGQSPQR